VNSLDPLVARARGLVAEHLERLPDSPVVIGLSGGADSLALVAVSSFFVQRGAVIRALVVDHGLQAGSREVAMRAAEQSESLGVPALVAALAIDPNARGGPEAVARRARYEVLTMRQRESDPAEVVWTAHTLDDQAETVVLGLGRGSGPRSIAGMRRFTGAIERPFLSLRRTETEAVCRAYGLTWWTDPHNSDSRFRRVRVRNEVLPLLEEVLGQGVAEALARTADLVRADADALDISAARARQAMGEATQVEDLWLFAEFDLPLRSRIWRLLALEAGAIAGELSHERITALDSLLTAPGGTRIQLPGGVSAVRAGQRVIFEPTPA
jgi:tRNA(Ile)-lysidine synthase